MREAKIKNCAHTSFSCELENVTGIRIKIPVIRCTDCGMAIGVLWAQIPDALNAIGEKLDAILKKV
jgi:hypothetical protein